MAKETKNPLSQMAQAAQREGLIAYREWPVYVVLRQKELLARQAKAPASAPAVPAGK